MNIAPGVHRLKVPIPDNPLEYLNCYLVQGKDGWLMVDTGWYTPEAFDSLKAGLASLRISLGDITTIVLTHVHPDHFGLAGRIKQASPGIVLMAHRWESDLIESRYIKFDVLSDRMSYMLKRHGVPAADLPVLSSASMPALQFVTVTFPDHTLYGGEVISTGAYDLEIIWTPGHSPGHICLYEPENKFLFAGDHVLPSISPNVSYHVQSGDNPLGDYMSSLHKLESLPVSLVLPAHEDVFADLRGRIQQIVTHHNRRKEQVLKAMAGNSQDAYTIASRLSWNVPGLTWEQFPPMHKRIAVTETIAHLEMLRWEGRVARTLRNDSFHYQAT
jgi:glyoxylase-like metal-dependent hydrolase (beta-lactamase superfamily II)